MSNRPKRQAATAPRRSRPATGGRSTDRTILLAIGIGAGVVALVTIVVFLVVGPGGDDADDVPAVAINGDSLVDLPEAPPDPAIGVKAPLFVADDLDGNRVVTGSGGGPNDPARIIGFFAHWCPVCQDEVTWMAPRLAANPMPDRVEFTTVTTFIDSGRDNYPPDDWFTREGWPLPVLLDDDSVIRAYGLGSVPGWVVLDDQNRVLTRLTGPVGPAGFEELIALAETGIDS